MSDIKAKFFLPLRDNDGTDLSDEIQEVERALFVRFSGWTFEGYVKGAFRMADGTRSLDESGAYIVIIDESRIEELEQILTDFKSRTTQEAIYLEIQRDVDVRFL